MRMISKSEATERANANWMMWRLLLSDMSITYSDLMIMNHDDMAEANAALDIHIKRENDRINKK